MATPDRPRVIGRLHVPPELAAAHERLDRLVAEVFPGLFPSRKRAWRAAKRGEIRVDGEPAPPQSRPTADALLEVLEPAQRVPRAWRTPLEVAHLDPWLAIVVKPAGVPVHGPRLRCLEGALVHRLPPSDEPDALAAARPVHRLDIRTSGLIVVARAAKAQVALGRLFQQRKVHKEYRALVAGRLEGEGEVVLPVGGRDARSRYRAVASSRSLHTDWLTEVALEPVTGRTHQLRQHMEHLGHPLLGDDLYPGRYPVLRGAGLFLASVVVGFVHPITGEPLRVAVEPPRKFARFREREEERWSRSQPQRQGSKATV